MYPFFSLESYLCVINVDFDRWRKGRKKIPVRERRVHATMCELQAWRERLLRFFSPLQCQLDQPDSDR